jgi:hypothetical protein
VSRRWLLSGALGSLLIAGGSTIVGTAPTHGHLPDGLGYLAAYGGLTLLLASWLGVGAALREGGSLTPAQGYRLLLAWSTPLVLSAPLYSRDAYSYVAQGRMAQLGINPYLHGPISLGPGPYLRAVSPIWARTRAPYGPLFVALASFVSRVLPSVTAAVLAMRALAVLGVILIAIFLPRLARCFGRSEATAVWLGLLNPLLVLHLIGGSHNESLMLGLMIAGITVASEGRTTRGLVLCTMAAAIKAPAGLAVLYIAADHIHAAPRGPARQRAAVTAATVVAAVFIPINQALGFGWGWVTALGTPTRVHLLLSPTTALGTVLSHLGGGTAAETAVRLLGVGVSLVAIAAILMTRQRFEPGRPLALSLLLVVVLAPVLQPWYLLWGLVPLAAAGPRRLLALCVWVSAVVPFLILPNGTSATPAVFIVFLGLTALVALRTLPIASLAEEWA